MKRTTHEFSGSVAEAIAAADQLFVDGVYDAETRDAILAYLVPLLGDINGDGMAEADQGEVEFQFVDMPESSQVEHLTDITWTYTLTNLGPSDTQVNAVFPQLDFTTADNAKPNAAIVIPAYQDYTVRSKVSEGLGSPWGDSFDVLIF